jgi:hypothetical protein
MDCGRGFEIKRRQILRLRPMRETSVDLHLKRDGLKIAAISGRVLLVCDDGIEPVQRRVAVYG